jgi:tRNA1(Val) A37 N6-methylase TrmN6
MLAAPALSLRLAEKGNLRILVLGTGAGLLPMFLRSQLNSVLAEIVTVDINPEVIKVISFNILLLPHNNFSNLLKNIS